MCWNFCTAKKLSIFQYYVWNQLFNSSQAKIVCGLKIREQKRKNLLHSAQRYSYEVM